MKNCDNVYFSEAEDENVQLNVQEQIPHGSAQKVRNVQKDNLSDGQEEYKDVQMTEGELQTQNHKQPQKQAVTQKKAFHDEVLQTNVSFC